MSELSVHAEIQYPGPNTLAVREFPNFHSNQKEFCDSVFARSLSGPYRLSICNLVEIRRKSRE